jgi:hypothetical protein
MSAPGKYWFGANDIDREGQWVWNDGQIMDYSGFNSSPRTVNDCGLISDWGVWTDESCLDYYPFVCEKSGQIEYEYIAVDERQTFQDARSACRNWGGDLASITSQNE